MHPSSLLAKMVQIGCLMGMYYHYLLLTSVVTEWVHNVLLQCFIWQLCSGKVFAIILENGQFAAAKWTLFAEEMLD